MSRALGEGARTHSKNTQPKNKTKKGAATPPKYGDYEAQRHWMELTTSLPVAEWYTDGPHNEPSYWPLDYPPLSGYQSWLHGHLVRRYEPAAVELHTSRGYETPSSKLLLRWTVVLSDLVGAVVVLWLCVRLQLMTPHKTKQNKTKQKSSSPPRSPPRASLAAAATEARRAATPL